MSDYEVGRGKPPKHSQFKPGQTGNSRGRPRKIPKMDTPAQFDKYIRDIGRRKVKLGTEITTVVEGLLLRLAQDGLRGNRKSAEIFLEKYFEAMERNMISKPILGFIEITKKDMNSTLMPEEEAIELLKFLSDTSKY